MNKRIITISREFGSGGRYIGEEIARKLGIAFYDKEIIAKVAEKTGMALDLIEQKGEYAPTKSAFAYAFVGRYPNGSSIDDILHQAQREIILEAVDKEPCVIVGRGADYILKDRKDGINVFIHGDQEKKADRICNLYHKTTPQAIKLMHDMDKKRSINYKYYTEQDWGVCKNYTISLNSSELGYEKCMDLIMDLYRD